MAKVRMRVATLLLLLCLVGCGPSAQERYETALSILEKEKAASIEADAAWDASDDRIKERLYKQFNPKADPDSYIEEMRKSTFMVSIHMDSTDEAKAYRKAQDSDRAFDEVMRQNERVRDAKKRAEEAEAALK